MAFRNGTWVRFKGECPGAHTTPDGDVVGIFVRGGVDGLGQKHADKIMVVNPDGNNVPVMKDGAVVNLSVSPDEAVDLQALADLDHIPAERRAKMDPNFQL